MLGGLDLDKDVSSARVCLQRTYDDANDHIRVVSRWLFVSSVVSDVLGRAVQSKPFQPRCRPDRVLVRDFPSVSSSSGRICRGRVRRVM